MNNIEKKELREKILEKIYELLNGNLNEHLENHNKIINSFSGIEESIILGEMQYLEQMGFLSYKLYNGIASLYPVPIKIKLTAKAIDFIENNNSLSGSNNNNSNNSYNINIENINSSQFVVGSDNNITFSTNDENILINYLENLLELNKENIQLKNIINQTKQDIKTTSLSDKIFYGVGLSLKSLANMGLGIATNLLTPYLAQKLGITLN